MKPPLKVEWQNVSLTIPKTQTDYLDELAGLLGISRNAIFSLALRMGGPLLARHAENIKLSVKLACERFSPPPPVETVETPGAADLADLAVKTEAHERKRRRKRR